MEAAFGMDFGGVESFTGRPELSGMGASAAAVGEQVAFAKSAPDRETVAHELTHVVQGRGSTGEAPPHARSEVSSPQDSAEQEAQTVAASVVAGRSFTVSSQLGGGVVSRENEITFETPDLITGQERRGSFNDLVEATRRVDGVMTSVPTFLPRFVEQREFIFEDIDVTRRNLTTYLRRSSRFIPAGPNRDFERKKAEYGYAISRLTGFAMDTSSLGARTDSMGKLMFEADRSFRTTKELLVAQGIASPSLEPGGRAQIHAEAMQEEIQNAGAAFSRGPILQTDAHARALSLDTRIPTGGSDNTGASSGNLGYALNELDTARSGLNVALARARARAATKAAGAAAEELAECNSIIRGVDMVGGLVEKISGNANKSVTDVAAGNASSIAGTVATLILSPAMRRAEATIGGFSALSGANESAADLGAIQTAYFEYKAKLNALDTHLQNVREAGADQTARLQSHGDGIDNEERANGRLGSNDERYAAASLIASRVVQSTTYYDSVIAIAQDVRSALVAEQEKIQRFVDDAEGLDGGPDEPGSLVALRERQGPRVEFFEEAAAMVEVLMNGANVNLDEIKDYASQFQSHMDASTSPS